MPIVHGKFEVGFRGVGIAVAAAALLGGCATPTVVESVQTKDAGLSCDQLRSEIAEAEKMREAAEASWGSSGGNIIKGFIFFPSLFVSYENISTATKAADARKTHLAGIVSQKNCPPPKKPAAAPGKR